MPIYCGLAPLKAYRGDMKPVNIYKGSTKIAGWHSASYSGASPLAVDCNYNVPPDALVIDGKCSQTQSCWGTNLVTNGDFSNGTTGWGGFNVTNTIINNGIDIVTNVSTSEHFSGQNVSILPVVNHKYYGRVYCEPVIGKACVQMYNRKSDGSYEQLFPYGRATAGISSGILTVSSVYSVPSFIFRLSLLNSAGVVNFAGTTEEARFSYACMIDLTAAFGAGKEPTVAQMDAIMEQFPNSWFDGSAQLSTDNTTYAPNSPGPSFPAPISTITGDVTITGADGDSSDTGTVALGSNVCASLPDGTHDSYDAVTGVLTKRVGKIVLDGSTDALGYERSSTRAGVACWVFRTDAGGIGIQTASTMRCDRFLPFTDSVPPTIKSIGFTYIAIEQSRLSDSSVAAFKTWLAANPVTVYYKLATPTTVQLTPHLPVVRTGIKTLTVGADVVPTLSATVKSMD